MIELLEFSTAQDIADAIDGLGWFDDVSLQEDGRTVQAEINGAAYIIMGTRISGSSTPSGYTGVMFFTKGYNVSGSVTLPLSGDGIQQHYAYKTSKGLLFFDKVQPSSSESVYNCWMLAKTNTGKIAVAFPTYGGASSAAQYRTAAENETDGTLASAYVQYCSLGTAIQGKWANSPQLIFSPIPTHAAEGVSYIDGGIGFLLCPVSEACIIELDGVRYATNGVIALAE